MHLIDTPTAVGGLFSPGVPGTGTLATEVSADWLNAQQLELANAIEAAGLTLDKSDNTQLAKAIASIAGSRAGSRNLLANGDFRVWQRDTAASAGTSVSTSAAAGSKYTADRWNVQPDALTGGAGQVVALRQSFTPGQTDVAGEPTYFLRFQQTIAATVANPRLAQRLEDVRTAADRPIVLSVSLKCSVSIDAQLVVTQVFGAGGSASVEVSRTTLEVESGWNRYVVPVVVPSIAGKVLGSASYLEVRIEGVQGQTYTLDVADFQVELGSAASTYDRRPLHLELQYCQRYYEKSYAWDTPLFTVTQLGVSQGAVNGYDSTDKHRCMAQRFRVQKRATPTVRWMSAAAGTVNSIDYVATGGATVTVLSTLNASATSTGWPETAGSGSPGTTNVTAAHWEADAEL